MTIDLENVSTEEIKKELIVRSAGLLVIASQEITSAATLLADKDLDAEGPIANSIQALTIAVHALTSALEIVRDLKRGEEIKRASIKTALRHTGEDTRGD